MKFKSIKRSKYEPKITLADVPDGRYEVSCEGGGRVVRMLHERQAYAVDANGERGEWQSGCLNPYTVHQRLDAPMELPEQKWESLADVPEGVVVCSEGTNVVRVGDRVLFAGDISIRLTGHNPSSFQDCTPTGDFIEVEWENE